MEKSTGTGRDMQLNPTEQGRSNGIPDFRASSSSALLPYSAQSSPPPQECMPSVSELGSGCHVKEKVGRPKAQNFPALLSANGSGQSQTKGLPSHISARTPYPERPKTHAVLLPLGAGRSGPAPEEEGPGREDYKSLGCTASSKHQVPGVPHLNRGAQKSGKAEPSRPRSSSAVWSKARIREAAKAGLVTLSGLLSEPHAWKQCCNNPALLSASSRPQAPRPALCPLVSRSLLGLPSHLELKWLGKAS